MHIKSMQQAAPYLRTVANPECHARIVQRAVVNKVAPLAFRFEGIHENVARVAEFSVGFRGGVLKVPTTFAHERIRRRGWSRSIASHVVKT